MICRMVSVGKSVGQSMTPETEPNRRQQLALERIDFAVSELATILLSTCGSDDIARASICAVRRAVTPVVTRILSTN